MARWGKCDNIMTDQELEMHKRLMENDEEEKPIDSLQYNKMLLQRAMCKFLSEKDTRDLIRRVIARG